MPGMLVPGPTSVRPYVPDNVLYAPTGRPVTTREGHWREMRRVASAVPGR